METWDAIRARRNVRSFADRPIVPEDLDRILEAGRRTPSSVNQQLWDFVVCTAPAQLVELARVYERSSHVATSGATVALVAPRTTDREESEWIHYDLGQVTMSMMLAAADLGIGSGHGGVIDHEQARRVLELPADRLCVILIAFGYPADRPLRQIERPRRRPFSEVVHRGQW